MGARVPEMTERNYAREPLTKAEVEHIVDVAGGVAPVLSTRNKTVKEKGWKDAVPSKAVFVKAVLEDNNVIRRPVVIRGRKMVVGFDGKAIEALLS